MTIVSNTSPIINLAAIGELDLLRDLYGSIMIPPAVYHEIVVVGTGQPGAAEVRASSWISVRAPADMVLVAQLSNELDSGEAEAITLAIELGADQLLIDERLGRNVAARLGVPVIGLLGIFVAGQAKSG